MGINIKTLNINLNNQTSGLPLVAAILREVANKSISETETEIPAIGEKWGELDAIYAGVSRGEDGKPDAHLILWNDKPSSDLNWKNALAWGQGVNIELDSHVPTRFESALLYANLRDQFDHDCWYWTGAQYSEGGAYDGQDFVNGNQSYLPILTERRVRAVSRLPL